MYDGAENALYKRVGIRARVGVMHADTLVPSSFSRDSLQLWFSPWRTLVSSSVEILVLPVPYGAKKIFWRRSAALRRSAPSACQTAVVSRPHSSHPRAGQLGALVQSAQRGTSRGRRHPADRGCAAEPLRRLTGALQPLSPRRSCTPPAGRHNAVPQSTAVLTKQTNPSVPH